MAREVGQNAIEVPNPFEWEYPVPPMAEIHQFIVDSSIKELLPSELRQRIGRKKKACENAFGYGHWSQEDTIREVTSMIERGYFPPDAIRKEYKTRMNEVFQSPQNHTWTIGEEKEELDKDDILVFGGIVAAEVLSAEEFWNDIPGFSGPSDMHGTVGALLMQNRDMFFELGGYEWETKKNAQVTHKTRITGSIHGDLRIERVCVSSKPAIDPFGNNIHYRPLTHSDRQRVAAYHSTEPILLAAALKYIDQEKINVECLKDGGKELLNQTRAKGLRMGNFGDFGTNGSSPQVFMWQFSHPMQQADDEGVFWGLGMEHHEAAYRIHIDKNRHLAFTMMNRKGELNKEPSLTLPPEEMEQLIQGIFAQCQQGKGRTSVRQLQEILEYRFSDKFAADMEKYGEK